jgi:hypothetical protein
MYLEMLILGQYATSNYFKNQNTLFNANYEFVHPPICGPITLGPKGDGELIFPYKNSFGLPISGSTKKMVKCIWELKVASQRDLWLSLDKARFGIYGSCEVAKIEVYLAGRLEPRFIVCPENASLAKDLPILSAAELGATDVENEESLPVIIQYTGDNRQPGKMAFRLVWTELFHLPRNTDGSLAATQMLTSPCEFHCPNDPSICLPKHLLCNGIINCPNTTNINNSYNTYIDQQNNGIRNNNNFIKNIESNLQSLGIFDMNIIRNSHLLNDESPELCKNYNNNLFHYDKYEYLKLSLIVAGLCFVVVMFIAVLCKMCRRHKSKSINEE